MQWEKLLVNRRETLERAFKQSLSASFKSGTVHERITLLGKMREAIPWWQRKLDDAARAHGQEALTHFETSRQNAILNEQNVQTGFRTLIADYRAALDVLEYIKSMRRGLPGVATMDVLDDVCGTAAMALQEAGARMERYRGPEGEDEDEDDISDDSRIDTPAEARKLSDQLKLDLSVDTAAIRRDTEPLRTAIRDAEIAYEKMRAAYARPPAMPWPQGALDAYDAAEEHRRLLDKWTPTNAYRNAAPQSASDEAYVTDKMLRDAGLRDAEGARHIRTGDRWRTLYAQGRSLAVALPDEWETKLRQINETQCDEPLDDSEMNRLIRDIRRRFPANDA